MVNSMCIEGNSSDSIKNISYSRSILCIPMDSTGLDDQQEQVLTMRECLRKMRVRVLHRSESCRLSGISREGNGRH
jgi:hypothetical protein